MLRLLFSLVLSLALGYLLIGRLLPTLRRRAFGRLLKLSLGTGLGLGISSCIYFVGLLIFTPSGTGLRLFDTGIHAGIIFGLFLISRTRSNKHPKDPPHTDFSTSPVLPYLFWATLIISILTFGLMALQSPYGRQNALSIWNLRARVLLKGKATGCGIWLPLASILNRNDSPHAYRNSVLNAAPLSLLVAWRSVLNSLNSLLKASAIRRWLCALTRRLSAVDGMIYKYKPSQKRDFGLISRRRRNLNRRHTLVFRGFKFCLQQRYGVKRLF